MDIDQGIAFDNPHEAITFNKQLKTDYGLTDRLDPELSTNMITHAFSQLPKEHAFMIMKNMSATTLITCLLLDNPSCRFINMFYDYLIEMKKIANEPNNECYQMLGINAHEVWQNLLVKEHLLEIAVNEGMFWEYISANAPFTQCLLIAIENDDVELLFKFVMAFGCLETDMKFYIVEYLIKYAFNFRKFEIIEVILAAIKPIIKSNVKKLGAMMHNLVDYIMSHPETNTIFDVKQGSVNCVALVNLLNNTLENNMLFTLPEINWNKYLYFLVKHDAHEELKKVMDNLKKKTGIRIDLLTYAIVNEKFRVTDILRQAKLEWVDNRDEIQMLRYSNLSREELEQVLYNMVNNMASIQSKTQKKCSNTPSEFSHMTFHTDVRELYDMQKDDKRFHTSVYMRLCNAKHIVCRIFQSRTTSDEDKLFQLMAEELAPYQEAFEQISLNLHSQLTLMCRLIDKYNVPDEFNELANQYLNMIQFMFS